MTKWLLAVLMLSVLCWGQSVTTLDQNTQAWGAIGGAGTTVGAASGTQLFLPDTRGTITNQFELVQSGTAPATLTVTIVGCMRGGTCSGTLASSSGTGSQIITPTAANLNIYDKYGVTVSWTGGDATTRFVVNRTGTVARLGSGSGVSWSAVTSGANTNTGLFSWAQSGTFTNAAINENFIMSLTGGSSCSTNNIINPSGGTTKMTDVFAACLNLPAGSGVVTNGFNDAIGAYVQNNNSSAQGTFGDASVIAFQGAAVCSANTSKCSGLTAQVTDNNSATSTTLIGFENDVGTTSTTGAGLGVYVNYIGTQTSSGTFPAVQINNAGAAAGKGWTKGVECISGAIQGSQRCLDVGTVSGGTNTNSQTIFFNANNGGNITSTLSLNQDNVFVIGTRAQVFLSPSTDEANGIALTSTASIGQNQLVKIDTANPDAIVVCTTADTVCHGFVLGTNNANGLCTVGSTFCPIAMGSGQKVHGILGTGTCAIGNFVIVDTTTNGRIKCTASQPATGAEIGIAIQAVSVVGNTVDLITKFQ